MPGSSYTGDRQPNALINQTSPYLLQHAYNPVQWHPWNQETLDLAVQQNKPILLSIGYSACHWCHVMARESFEDPAIAEVMNEHFINIKVDREERPDLDKLYQIAQQLLTRRGGGWPLTVFLAPDDQVPFFAGTYFPREPRFGLPGFADLLQRVARFYREEQDALRQQNRSFMEAMAKLQPAAPVKEDELNDTPVIRCIEELAANFDHVNGGFSAAPKFPQAGNLEFLLQQHWQRRHEDQARSQQCRDMATQTLAHMARGGIYDQIGGGFYRYSVDETWTIPHFEKMLYDNASLLAVYAEAWWLTGEPLFRDTATETAAWVMREMQSVEGGYYSSLDADSEGQEGRFYTWTPEEVHALLDENEYRVLAPRLGLDREANFEGRWHLRMNRSADTIAGEVDLAPGETQELLRSARSKLLTERDRRVRPGRDEKILTAWNGLMIRGMAVASARLAEPAWLESAERALEFVHRNLWQDGRLLATCRDGHAHLNAYLDDYALLLDGILHLLQGRWQTGWLNLAMQLADTMLAQFQDPETGGFFFTSHDHEALIQRRKEFMDDAMPSGNGIAAGALYRLGCLTGRGDYLEAAAGTLPAAWPEMQRLPHAHTAVLQAFQTQYQQHRQILLRGPRGELDDWRREVVPEADPLTEVFTIPADESGLPALLAERPAAQRPLAYICTGTRCQAPIDDLDTLMALLRSGEGAD